MHSTELLWQGQVEMVCEHKMSASYVPHCTDEPNVYYKTRRGGHMISSTDWKGRALEGQYRTRCRGTYDQLKRLARGRGAV